MDKGANAIRILMDDHKRIRGLFRQFEAVDKRAVMKSGVCRQIFMELEIHAELEETFFYPVLEDAFKDQSLQALVEECVSDHTQVKDALSELRGMQDNQFYAETFDERMNDLVIEVEQHISKEESEVFAHAHATALSQLEQVADQMLAEQVRLRALPEYRESLPQFVQDPAGGEQKRTSTEAA